MEYHCINKHHLFPLLCNNVISGAPSGPSAELFSGRMHACLPLRWDRVYPRRTSKMSAQLRILVSIG